MVVIVKKKVIKPPSKYEFEKIPKDLDYNMYIRTVSAPTATAEYDHKVKPPLYAVAWGWNANGRAGNITKEEIREPQHIQRTVHHRFIDCASGKHHSLLLADTGNVFSFGEGRQHQLGLGNPITIVPIKGGEVQTCPRQVSPSGNLINKSRDFKIAQVGCGSYYSVVRELTAEEGVALCHGLPELEEKLKILKNLFSESLPIQKVWSAIRQEHFRIGRHCGGRLLSWGTGKHGELGLGKYLTDIPYPLNILKLKYVSISTISAGYTHVLAVDSNKQLYSWGSGRSGRLGHGDYYDRLVPTLVEFFLPFYVEQCAAGHSHSAVLTTSRKGNGSTIQPYRVASFGRGAYGRLGVGNNYNMPLPVAVTQWFSSFESFDIKQICCGGAHTLALGVKHIPKTLANPLGTVTIVAAWGYGGNGQLGTGAVDFSLIPVKCRIPKWEIIAEISAGKSWSMARTIGGELYTWGRGLRGQLGLGVRDFSLAPRKLDSFAAFLKLSSGYAHNVCITTNKRTLNPKSAEFDGIYKSKSYIKNTTNNCTTDQQQDVVVEAEDAVLLMKRKSITNTLRLSLDSVTSSTILPAIAALNIHDADNSYRRNSLTVSKQSSNPSRNHSKLLTMSTQQANSKVTTTNSNNNSNHNNDNNMVATTSSCNVSIRRLSMNSVNNNNNNLPRLSLVNGNTTQLSNKNNDVHDIDNSTTTSLSSAATLLLHHHHHHRPRAAIDHSIGNYDPISDKMDINLETSPPDYQYLFHCCRRIINHTNTNTNSNDNTYSIFLQKRSQLRFNCQTCQMLNICLLCTKLCHYKHELHLLINNTNNQNKISYCRCGVEKNCKLLPTIPEVTKLEERKGRPKKIKLKNNLTEYIKNKQFLKLQQFCKLYVQKKIQLKSDYMKKRIQFEVCEAHYERSILQTIWNKLEDSFGSYLENRERLKMSIEDHSRKVYDFNYRLQKALLGMEAMMKGVQILLGRASICSSIENEFMSLSATTTTDNTTAIASRERRDTGNRWKPTFTMSWCSLRNQQYNKHQSRRISHQDMSTISQYFPRYCPPYQEDRYSDVDIQCFTSRYMKDTTSTRSKRLQAVRKARAAAVSEAKRLAVAPRFAGSRAKLAAKKEELKKTQQLATTVLSRLVDTDSEQEENDDGVVVSGFQPHTTSIMSEVPHQRRHSIGSSEGLYSRVCQLRPGIGMSRFFSRTYSLPCNLHLLHPKQRNPLSYMKSIQQSLDMFYEREQTLYDFDENNANYELIWESFSKEDQRIKLKSVLISSCLTPRIPLEVADRYLKPRRRRSIAEPERIGMQLQVMLKIRKNFQIIRNKAYNKHSLIFRQRSFDPAENYENDSGLSQKLNFNYEEFQNINDQITKDELFLDLLKFEKSLVAKGLYKNFVKTKNKDGESTYDDDSTTTIFLNSDGKAVIRKIPPPPPPLPPEEEEDNELVSPVIWQQFTSSDGSFYFFNPITEESSWTLPEDDNVQVQVQLQDPNSGAYYWYNQTTGDSSWV